MPDTPNAIDYYLSKADHHRLEAAAAARPRQAKVLLELASAFEKHTQALQQILGDHRLPR